MYEPDGNELIVTFTKEGEYPATLSVDMQDYANMINDGWLPTEEVGNYVRVEIDPETMQAVKETIGGDDENITMGGGK